mmetsp:Transcript_9804/g.29004  ORF Transcript_9804/g.29004 Transcript_9804/m.29004 type:complete len:207 (-) Transcript_9804:51-671(-)
MEVLLLLAGGERVVQQAREPFLANESLHHVLPVALVGHNCRAALLSLFRSEFLQVGVYRIVQFDDVMLHELVAELSNEALHFLLQTSGRQPKAKPDLEDGDFAMSNQRLFVGLEVLYHSLRQRMHVRHLPRLHHLDITVLMELVSRQRRVFARAGALILVTDVDSAVVLRSIEVTPSHRRFTVLGFRRRKVSTLLGRLGCQSFCPA